MVFVLYYRLFNNINEWLYCILCLIYIMIICWYLFEYCVNDTTGTNYGRTMDGVKMTDYNAC